MDTTVITEKLRQATRESHDRLEATGYAQALTNGTIATESYVGYLRVLGILHGTLEPLLENADNPVLKGIWRESLRRVGPLAQDLNYFRMNLIPDAPDAIDAAQKTAAEIRRLSIEEPVALVGVVYTLYGSSMGAKELHSTLCTSLGIRDSRGASYITYHGGEGVQQWRDTARRIDSSAIDESGIKSAAESADLVFQCVGDAFLALHPLDPATMRFTASTLNPDSGNYPVPQDRDVLRAVLRTTDRVLNEYPYVLYRFGERGRRFTDADGAWLATLPGLGEFSMTKQLNWIRTVLSSRGVPHVLVARHLHFLAEELSATSFDESGLSLLSRAAERIYRSIDEKISPALRSQREAELARLLSPEPGKPGSCFMCREAIDLLASAVADADSGVENALESLTSYLLDERRFSRVWIDSVTQTIRLFQEP